MSGLSRRRFCDRVCGMNILVSMLRSLVLSVAATFAHKQVFGRLNGRQSQNEGQSRVWGAPNSGADAIPDQSAQ